MRETLLPLLLLVSLYSCSQQAKKEDAYPEHVGDISFDKNLDDPNFKICNPDRVFQYYNFGKGLQYKGEKPAINQYFNDHLKLNDEKGESGFLIIRFVVNCEGKTGWFRVQGMDDNYKEKKFSKDLEDQLLALTRQLDGWIAASDAKNKFDYYQYLTFKINDGKLIEIMP